ncbi:MAG: hypothetical protein E6J34_14075 [Chloroflexi bacterium]|nr:MAG: hypothetical protein E6J34_14075 [Chloroflexota bacterium]
MDTQPSNLVTPAGIQEVEHVVPSSPPPGTLSAPTAPQAWQPTQPISIRAEHEAAAHSPQQLPPSQLPDPLSHYQTGSRVLEQQNNKKQSKNVAKRTRRRGGCMLGCLGTLVLLLLLVGASWIFVARPYLHNIVQRQLDQAMANAVDSVPTLPAQLPPPGPLTVTDAELNSLLARNLVSSSPVQNAQAHIASGAIHLTFDAYGQACAMSVTPVLEQNGHLVAKNVTVEGIMGLVMSPEEITATMNRHLAAAQSRINHPIKKFQIRDTTIDVQLD